MQRIGIKPLKTGEIQHNVIAVGIIGGIHLSGDVCFLAGIGDLPTVHVIVEIGGIYCWRGGFVRVMQRFCEDTLLRSVIRCDLIVIYRGLIPINADKFIVEHGGRALRYDAGKIGLSASGQGNPFVTQPVNGQGDRLHCGLHSPGRGQTPIGRPVRNGGIAI